MGNYDGPVSATEGKHPGAGWLADPGKRFGAANGTEYASPMDAAMAVSNMPHLVTPKNAPLPGIVDNVTDKIVEIPSGDNKNYISPYGDVTKKGPDPFHPHNTMAGGQGTNVATKG